MEFFNSGLSSINETTDFVIYRVKKFINVGIYTLQVIRNPNHDTLRNHPKINKQGDSAAHPVPMYLDNELPPAMDQTYDFTENLLNSSLFLFYAFFALWSFNVNAYMGDFEAYFFYLLEI